MRHELGDLIPLESAGASDLAGVDRLWELSVRGATSEWSGQATPTLEEKVGEVWVRRWDLKEPDIVYDFTRHILDRRAEYEKDGSKIPCILKKSHRGNGGLFRGPLPPEERFICEGRRTWSWIGPTVNEDLDQKPRHCVWQHPLGKEPLRVIFENVPLGNELRISTGLFYHHDRATKDNQYELRVTVGDNVGQTIVHRDGQGWITKAIDLRSLRNRANTCSSYRRNHCRSIQPQKCVLAWDHGWELAMKTTTSMGARDHVTGLVICVAYVALLVSTAGDIGMSRDESFYVQAAQDYAAWMQQVVREPKVAFERAAIDHAWDYNWEHPPLMKASFALGWIVQQKTGLFGSDSLAFRFPGMLTAGLLLWLIYIWGTRIFGRRAGLFAALCFALMPRVFYHAHLNCFDVPITLMITAVTYCYWRSLTSSTWVWITGFVFGLALLTKHNSWVLPGIFLIHFVWLHRVSRRRGLAMSTPRWPWWLIAMLSIGPLIFAAGWPWLWNDTWARVVSYVNFHFRHDYYNIAYFGTTYFRSPFPMSYPFVLTLFTVPLIFVCLAVTGVFSRRRELWPFGDGSKWKPTIHVLPMFFLSVRCWRRW